MKCQNLENRMNAIEKIQIKEFRTHHRIDIELDPAITTITGRNFAGKSTIIRALVWVAMNKPAGTSFINWDADKTAVRIVMDKRKITRTRSKSINNYKLSGKKKPYEAFYHDVPADIAKILNLSDINFQGQQSAPFWFCETAGEVSRQLNSIINLDVIDNTLANLVSEKFKTQAVINATTEALDEAIKKKKELKYVKRLNKELLNVETLQRRYLENAGLLAELTSFLDLATKYKDVNDNQSRMATGGKKILSKGRICQKIDTSIKALSKLIETGTQLGIVLSHKPPSLSPLNKLMVKMKREMDDYNSLNEMIGTIQQAEEMKSQTGEKLKWLKQKLKKIKGKRCPLCGQLTVQKS